MPDWTRRDLLLATSTGTAGALAGCAGLVSETTETTTQGEPSTTSATTENESRDSPGYLEYHWHGKLFMDVDGRLVNFDRPKYYLDNIEDEDAVYFHFHKSAHGANEWSNEKQTVTLAKGLNLLPDVDYSREGKANVLAYEGTTFDGRSQGTEVTIYEGTDEIDPTQHQVEHAQNFWIHVDTGRESQSTDDGTKTGSLVLDVNNRRLDFSKEVYRSAGTEQFGFRDDGEPYRWYSEADSVTLATALDTLPNVEYEQDDAGNHVIEYSSGESYTGTYRDAAEETEILVRRRAEPLDPTEHELQDGDVLWVYVHSTKAPDNEH